MGFAGHYRWSHRLNHDMYLTAKELMIAQLQSTKTPPIGGVDALHASINLRETYWVSGEDLREGT